MTSGSSRIEFNSNVENYPNNQVCTGCLGKRPRNGESRAEMALGFQNILSDPQSTG